MASPVLKLFTPGSALPVFLVLFVVLVPLFAQEPSSLKTLYERLQFEKTIQLGHQLLNSKQSFTPQELIDIHQYLGFSYFNLGQLDSARTHFLTILQLNPRYQFDPVTTSPKIITFFEQLKKQQSGPNLKARPIRYILIKDKRPQASLKSLVLPGWGQYFKGQKKRAYLFFSAFGASVAATTTAAFLEKHYHQKYRTIDDVQKLDAAYQRYNRWYKWRRYGTLATAAIWVASVLDAMWTPYNWNTGGVTFSGNGYNYQLTISFNF